MNGGGQLIEGCYRPAVGRCIVGSEKKAAMLAVLQVRCRRFAGQPRKYCWGNGATTFCPSGKQFVRDERFADI